MAARAEASPDGVVLMIIQPGERNAYDQQVGCQAGGRVGRWAGGQAGWRMGMCVVGSKLGYT